VVARQTPQPTVFLLRRPDEVRQDGFTNTYTPFIITYDHLDVYAAFTSPEIATYFMQALRLDKAYKAVPLHDTDDLTHAAHALVLSRRSQVDTLLRGITTAQALKRYLLKVR
jgi:hypothetical protein